MTHEILWALSTAGITGAVWAGILAWQLHRRLLARQTELTDQLQQRLDALEAVSHRLAEAEERLDFAERRLAQGAPARREPPDA